MITDEKNYSDRNDSFEEKIRLIQKAYRDGKYDLAMSLAESIKDTLSFQRQTQADIEPPTLDANSFGQTTELPQNWAFWAKGWNFYKALILKETTALDRIREPVDIPISFRPEQITSPMREIRVAQLEASKGVLTEIPSQVYKEIRRGKERLCHVCFLADVPANGSTTYLIFYGNPSSELPSYNTDLKVTGEDFKLDIENEFYKAQLSRQMGQLERLTIKRAHGLELFAGGEGHGEPPGIDWAHDYVSSGNFQKFRVTNWPKPPNYEVVKGPLCVQVRRWGFPQSPLHPIYLPARMHIDVTYTFYSGTPYFLKQGSMDITKPLEVIYLRDDEWVFSGYSFTDILWMSRDGKLRQGEVIKGHENDLWAVGFYNRFSRDAFIALRLEHKAEGFKGGFYQSGVPVLNYQGHGQLWSRWAVHQARFDSGASLKQKNAYLTIAYPEESESEIVERYRYKLMNPLRVEPTEVPKGLKAAELSGSLARLGEGEEDSCCKLEIWKALRDCKDEQLYSIEANVVDMGYIYDVRLRGDRVQVIMTMPHKGRPKYGFLANPIRQRLLKLKWIREVVVELVWEPTWTANLITDEGRSRLGLD